jgi:hypothetical protein
LKTVGLQGFGEINLDQPIVLKEGEGRRFEIKKNK